MCVKAVARQPSSDQLLLPTTTAASHPTAAAAPLDGGASFVLALDCLATLGRRLPREELSWSVGSCYGPPQAKARGHLPPMPGGANQ